MTPYQRAREWAESNSWTIAPYLGLMAVAAAMRLWDLGLRAMHHDESLHAYYAWNLYGGNGYQHNPMMHGPFQMEATAAAFFIFGDSDFTARLLYAIAGTVLVGLPYFLRARLGNLGALFVSTMLAFSPAVLYFSRFARNDILIAVWTLGLVVCMWRYIDEGRHRYLYMAAAVLALAFATKETAYIVTTTLGLYLAAAVVAQNWSAIRQGITVGEASPPVAIAKIISGTWSSAARGLRLSQVSPPADFLVLLLTLSLPLGAALVSALQDTALLSWSGLVLASAVGESGPIGAPTRGGLVIAALVVLGLIWVSAWLGFRWKRSVWWRCALIFWVIWALLYSTFFTNLAGIGSGFWQSLGYWLVQQSEGRGGQPWYYYFLITSIYEFLPLLFAVIGGVYYMRRKDPFGRFLVVWAATTFVLYTFASEKMPWLLVNIALPMIVLSGKFLGDVIREIEWRRLVSTGGLLVIVGVPAYMVLFWRLAFASADLRELSDLLILIASLAVLGAMTSAGFFVARRIGYRSFASLAVVPVAAILLALGVRAGWYASYQNADTPVEMIVYTQTSPDIPRLLRQVETAGDALGDRTAVPITIDGTSGFTWPWAWYLRNYTRVGFPSYDGAPLNHTPDASVLLIHSRNQASADELLADRYTEGMRIKHRWWFPEDYRGMTLGKFMGALVDRDAWRAAMDYFLYRKLSAELGSEDSYIYFSEDFPAEFSPSS